MFAAWFRPLGCFALVGILSLGHGAAAWGQGTRRPMRRYQSSANEPFVSPYMNLALPTGNPGLNYFSLVQPQLQQMRTNETNASRIYGLNQDLQQAKSGAYGPTGGIRPTGRAATYGNYSHYYPSMGGGGGAGGPGGGGRGGPARNYPSPVGVGGMGGMGMF